MTFSKYTFLMLGLASMFSFDAVAYRNNCSFAVDAGKYCYNAGNKKACPGGCYCVGNTNFAVGNDSDRDPDTACYQKKSSVEGHLNQAGIKYCPNDFPLSASGSSNINQCFFHSNTFNKDVYYKQVNCPAGQYLPRLTQKCVSCSASVYCRSCSVASPNARGYICTGTNGTVTPKEVDQGVKKCGSNEVPNSDQTACIKCNWNEEPNATQIACKPKDCPQGQYIYSNGVCTNCPTGFTTKLIDASVTPYSIEGCHYRHPSNNGTWVMYKTHNCPAGQFLPANSNGCMKCSAFPSETAGKICTGGNFTPSTQSQGLTDCPSGKIPNPDQTACINAPTMVETPQTVVETLQPVVETPTKTTCIPGEYLKANSSVCSPCPKGKLCLGGTFETMRSIDQGADGKCTGNNIVNSTGTECVACEFGKVPNSAHTSCVSAGSITVNPGYFLPKGSNTPKGCTGTSRYCPGGSFNMSQTSDQGIENCPANSRTTEDKTACAVTLTKKQMMYGINGTGGRYSENAVQCWTKTGADYKACMGFKSDGSWTSTSVPGLSINLKPIKAELKPVKAELKQFNLASPLVQAASKDLVTKESPRKD